MLSRSWWGFPGAARPAGRDRAPPGSRPPAESPSIASPARGGTSGRPGPGRRARIGGRRWCGSGRSDPTGSEHRGPPVGAPRRPRRPLPPGRGCPSGRVAERLEDPFCPSRKELQQTGGRGNRLGVSSVAYIATRRRTRLPARWGGGAEAPRSNASRISTAPRPWAVRPGDPSRRPRPPPPDRFPPHATPTRRRARHPEGVASHLAAPFLHLPFCISLSASRCSASAPARGRGSRRHPTAARGRGLRSQRPRLPHHRARSQPTRSVGPRRDRSWRRGAPRTTRHRA
jgi:hypothetical protein